MKPNARKGRTGHLKQCIARTFLAIALVASSVPVSPRPATAIDDAANARIASMLATGEFVEGEAVAIVRQGAEVEAAVQTEELAKVDAGTVEETARAGAAESAADGETALRAQAAGDERLEVRLVVDHGCTTEQLLRDLYADPDVISAEPNYITTATEAFGDDQAANSQSDRSEIGADATGASRQSTTEGATDVEGTAQGESLPAASENPGDLTSTQWRITPMSE